MQTTELTLIPNSYINKDEASALLNAELSMLKDVESDAIVLCYRDEIWIGDSGEYIINTDDFTQEYFEKFGHMLVTDKIAEETWQLLITLFDNQTESKGEWSCCQFDF